MDSNNSHHEKSNKLPDSVNNVANAGLASQYKSNAVVAKLSHSSFFVPDHEKAYESCVNEPGFKVIKM